MKPSLDPLGDLLALKRHERPEEGYWQEFLGEFHHRQRTQALATSPLADRVNRLKQWMADIGPARWAYGAGLAYATVAVTFLLGSLALVPDREAATFPISPASHQFERMESAPMMEPAMEQLDRLDLSPATQGSTGEQIF